MADPLAQTRQQVFDLQYLPEGWNGYDAAAPSAASVRLALHWLVSCYAACQDAGVRWHAPVVTATADGDVVLIWRTGDFTLSAQARVCPGGEQHVEFDTHWVGRSDLDEQEDAVPVKTQVKRLREFDGRVS